MLQASIAKSWVALSCIQQNLPIIAGGRGHSYNSGCRVRNLDIENADLKLAEQWNTPEGSIVRFWSEDFFYSPRGIPGRSPNQNGDPTFNLKFDFIYRSTIDRLLRFDTTAACGQWNSHLIEDFRTDLRFVSTANDLFSEVVAEHSNGKCIASDGSLLETVIIDLGVSISLCFRLSFLDAPNGCRDAPARFFVAKDLIQNGYSRATLSCGLSGPETDFWYPGNGRMTSVLLPDDYHWAYHRTRIYGPPTISSWIQRRANERGEPSDARKSPVGREFES